MESGATASWNSVGNADDQDLRCDWFHSVDLCDFIPTPTLTPFQLLAFFIMVYAPNTGEAFIGTDLHRQPSAGGLGKPAGVKPLGEVGDVEPKLVRTVTIVLNTRDSETASTREPVVAHE